MKNTNYCDKGILFDSGTGDYIMCLDLRRWDARNGRSQQPYSNRFPTVFQPVKQPFCNLFCNPFCNPFCNHFVSTYPTRYRAVSTRPVAHRVRPGSDVGSSDTTRLAVLGGATGSPYPLPLAPSQQIIHGGQRLPVTRLRFGFLFVPVMNDPVN